MVRCIGCIVILRAPWSGVGETLLQAIAQYPPTMYLVPNMLTAVSAMFFYSCIPAVLILQIRAIFATEKRIRNILTALGVLAALVMECFFVTWLVVCIYWDFSDGTFRPDGWFWVHNTYWIYFQVFYWRQLQHFPVQPRSHNSRPPKVGEKYGGIRTTSNHLCHVYSIVHSSSYLPSLWQHY